MATIDINRTHTLGIQKAREAVNAIAAELTRDLKVTSRWDGDTLRFHRAGAEGLIQVSGNDVRFQVDLSLLLRPLKSTIANQVQQYFDRYFQK